MRPYYRKSVRSVLCTERNKGKGASGVIHEKYGTIFTTVVALSEEIFTCIRKSIACWATSTSRRAVTFSRRRSCTRGPTLAFARRSFITLLTLCLLLLHTVEANELLRIPSIKYLKVKLLRLWGRRENLGIICVLRRVRAIISIYFDLSPVTVARNSFVSLRREKEVSSTTRREDGIIFGGGGGERAPEREFSADFDDCVTKHLHLVYKQRSKHLHSLFAHPLISEYRVHRLVYSSTRNVITASA